MYRCAFVAHGAFHYHRRAQFPIGGRSVRNLMISDGTRWYNPQRFLSSFQIRHLIGQRIAEALHGRVEIGIATHALKGKYRDMLFRAGVDQARELFADWWYKQNSSQHHQENHRDE